MRRALCSLVVLGVVLSGCQSRPDLDTPPDIRYGEDMCDQCRMIISEARYAAAYVTQQGATRRFDDIGDLLAFRAVHAEEVTVFWVHDYDTQTWLKADHAHFVVSSMLQTPMDHSIVALRDKTRAEELAASIHGRVLTFAELQRHPAARHAASAHMHPHHGLATTAQEHHGSPLPRRRITP
jgi:copper chaperone NosL